MGANDPFFPSQAAVARARMLLPDLHGAEVVGGVGHNMVSENVELINLRLLEFLLAPRHRPVGIGKVAETEESCQ
jgi:hypothetical protein